MTTTTPLELLKSHMAIDHFDDDALLSHKLAAAEAWVRHFVGSDEIAARDIPLVTEATLHLAAYWYEQREAASFGVTMAPVPFGVHAMLSGIKKQVTGHVVE